VLDIVSFMTYDPPVWGGLVTS